MTSPNRSTHAGKTVFASRRRALVRQIKRHQLDAMVVTRPPDVGYLTGFDGDDGSVLVAANWATLVAGPLYGEQARRQCGDIDVQVGQLAGLIAGLLKGRGIRRLGAQEVHLTAGAWRRLDEVVGSGRLVSADGLVGGLRVAKDAAELRAISSAVRTAQKAFAVLFGRGRKSFVGRTEQQVAAELDYQMRLAGADGAAFPTVVAAGKRASQPHYQPGSYRIRAGQPVLIDWGARVKGYCSDLTRVVFTDRIPPGIARIYEIVVAAQAAGIRAIKPGVKAKSVDRQARMVIEKGGYGDKFIHGLGHGLGREVHEGPAVNSRNEQRLGRNMVITVEPGIYLPGVGGVRIEDDVVVTADGRRRLSSVPVGIEKMLLR